MIYAYKNQTGVKNGSKHSKMKFYIKYFAACFFCAACIIFASFSLCCPLEDLNVNDYLYFETQLERPMSNVEEMRSRLTGEYDKECPHFYQYSKFLNLINHQKTVDDIINSSHEKVVILLADDMKDAITLAQFLSQNNRLLHLKNREHLDNSEKSVYDLILKNYHLYKNVNTSTVFFAYPRNTDDEVFARYVAQKVMENSKKVKVVLTLRNPPPNPDNDKFLWEKELRVNGIFKVFRNVGKYKNTTGFVVIDGKFTGNFEDGEDDLKIDQKEELDYVKLIDCYIKSTNTTDSEKLLAIYVNDGTVKVVYSSGFTRKNYIKLLTHINDVMSYADGSNFTHRSLSNRNFSISNDEFEKCITIFRNKIIRFYGENQTTG
ncbi:uncharacterized protein LOC117176554 [Belonocnema kinseyi]|uniref:uncharacterized protein LOC117176554 n=1 Tax=Belonocnema kinseyi TaxID=2817044 RepID=UPI00143D6CA6|nr:uncharacterized protein LOC117176554 [Belonocnema kinseyi]